MERENILSEYFNGLPVQDRMAYTSKLTLSNGATLPDPYSLSGQRVKDLTKWPKLQWPDIYVYLTDTPSVYTKDTLKAYKS